MNFVTTCNSVRGARGCLINYYYNYYYYCGLFQNVCRTTKIIRELLSICVSPHYTASKNYMQTGVFVVLHRFFNQCFGNLANSIVTFV